jgi:hypothetical protein
MKVGDLVSMAFAREQQLGIVIHIYHTGTIGVLINGIIHRATESMLSIINERR